MIRIREGVELVFAEGKGWGVGRIRRPGGKGGMHRGRRWEDEAGTGYDNGAGTWGKACGIPRAMQSSKLMRMPQCTTNPDEGQMIMLRAAVAELGLVDLLRLLRLEGGVG